MGEWVDISVNNLSLYWFKNYLDKKIVGLFFTSKDLVIIPNYKEEPEDEDCKPYTRYMYKTTVKQAKERLDALGYGLGRFEKIFEEKKERIIDYYSFLYHLNVDYDDYDEIVGRRVEKYVTYKKWANSMKKIVTNELAYGSICSRQGGYRELKLTTECDKVIYYSLKDDSNDSYYAINVDEVDCAYIFRMILESCELSDEIVLDFSRIDFYNDDCIPKALEATGNNEKTIVLVEGTSDKDMLEFALSRIYPHLSDLFYFMAFEDEHGKKRGGGAPEIRKHMQTFYYSKIRINFIAIFDNDAVGYHNQLLLENEISVCPDNIKILRYPDISDFKRYPTLVPNGSIVNDDINKKACSIELYLPDSIIRDEYGEYFPIEWESREKINRCDGKVEYLYQGVISEKDSIKRKFNMLKKEIDRDGSAFKLEEWNRMRMLLDTIVFALR